MAKVALLIGVSEYEYGLSPLPCAARDVNAMQRILEHSEMGAFQKVSILLNRDPLVIQEAVQNLFTDSAKEDLALLFFSGHGLKDNNGKFYFATRITRKNDKDELIKATAISASFVQDSMSNSRCKRQVVILDCCFSGAFADGMTAKGENIVDIQTQLGGKGRVILTSSTSTQYSFEQQGADLSIYTRYIVEGVETGAADADGDGLVSTDELHIYASRKVQEAAPAMQPKIYAVEEGFKIYIAKAASNDPKLKYRVEAERFASRGKISKIGRDALNILQEKLKLTSGEAAAIESAVLKPYQEYQEKLKRYEQILIELFQYQNYLTTEDENELRHYREILSLRDEDVAPIEERVKSSLTRTVDIPKPTNQYSLVWICIAALSVIVGIATLITISIRNHQAEQEALTNLKYKQQQGSYEECLKPTASILQSSPISKDAQEIIEECSKGILKQAEQEFQDKHNLNEAKRLITFIPKTTSSSEMAEKEEVSWTDEVYFRAAIEAYRKCFSRGVLKNIKKITSERWKAPLKNVEEWAQKNLDYYPSNCHNASDQLSITSTINQTP